MPLTQDEIRHFIQDEGSTTTLAEVKLFRRIAQEHNYDYHAMTKALDEQIYDSIPKPQLANAQTAAEIEAEHVIFGLKLKRELMYISVLLKHYDDNKVLEMINEKENLEELIDNSSIFTKNPTLTFSFSSFVNIDANVNPASNVRGGPDLPASIVNQCTIL